MTARPNRKKIIICESGATKADWRVIENGVRTSRYMSCGTNVSNMTMDAVRETIKTAASELSHCGMPDEVHFYTAGVITPQIQSDLECILGKCFNAGKVEVQTDLVASARAACGHKHGVVAILGTGSNSCLWDGEKIISQVRSGGFIIGDEGSASVLGKMFISDFIKGLVPEDISAGYAERFPSEYHEIVEMVYHNQGSPSAWLGSLCPFIMSFYPHPYVERLVKDNLHAFIERNLSQYDTDRYPVYVTGGFAEALKDIIRPAFEAEGIRIKALISSPVERLVDFHLSE